MSTRTIDTIPGKKEAFIKYYKERIKRYNGIPFTAETQIKIQLLALEIHKCGLKDSDFK